MAAGRLRAITRCVGADSSEKLKLAIKPLSARFGAVASAVDLSLPMPKHTSAEFTALLRGVNVGSGNRVPMAEFRAMLEALGFGGVRTLLNSGNAVFTSTAGSAQIHADRIRSELMACLGIDVPVIVKSAKEIVAIEAENPLAGLATNPSRLLVAFAPDAKALEGLARIDEFTRASEKFHLGVHAAYLWCPKGISRSRAAEVLLGKKGRAATTRNWATVLKIRALLSEDTR